MRRQETGGTILNMAWDHVLGGGTKGEYAEIFCAAKGGVYSFSRALARTVAPHVRVNVLGPGWVETAYGAELDPAVKGRSEEHTSELQSQSNLVCRLLLEKKKKKIKHTTTFDTQRLQSRL